MVWKQKLRGGLEGKGGWKQHGTIPTSCWVANLLRNCLMWRSSWFLAFPQIQQSQWTVQQGRNPNSNHSHGAVSCPGHPGRHPGGNRRDGRSPQGDGNRGWRPRRQSRATQTRVKYRLGKPWKHTGRGLEKLGEEADRQGPVCRNSQGWGGLVVCHQKWYKNYLVGTETAVKTQFIKKFQKSPIPNIFILQRAALTSTDRISRAISQIWQLLGWAGLDQPLQPSLCRGSSSLTSQVSLTNSFIPRAGASRVPNPAWPRQTTSPHQESSFSPPRLQPRSQDVMEERGFVPS